MEEKQTKRDIRLKCSRCDSANLERVEGLYALTKIEKNENGIAFMPASGIPIVVYVCKECGELKLMPAKLLGEI